MPNYDLQCEQGHNQIDQLQPVAFEQVPCPECGATVERVWLPGTSSHVIGDEVDVWIKHGLCNADGTPRHYTSRQEIAREAAKRGLVNLVTHQGGKGTDKSKHTTRWY